MSMKIKNYKRTSFLCHQTSLLLIVSIFFIILTTDKRILRLYGESEKDKKVGIHIYLFFGPHPLGFYVLRFHPAPPPPKDRLVRCRVFSELRMKILSHGPSGLGPKKSDLTKKWHQSSWATWLS